MIYLDNAATTQIAPEVLDAMMPYLTDNFGNAGTLYSLGRKAADAIAHARQQVADMLSCDPEQIIFTSGGTEANNLVFSGLRNYLIESGKKHIITSAIEHDSVLKTIQKMCIKDGFDATYLNTTKRGKILSNRVQASITPHTGVVSVMYVNNEIGSTNPISIIGNICHKNNVLFHTDCVQAVGNKELDVYKLSCDFLSVSSHKIHGPKGIGCLYVRDKSLLSPLIHGGVSQEFGLRGGTENVSGIVGFGKACEMVMNNIEINNQKTTKLKALFIQKLLESLEYYGISNILHINGYPPSDSRIINLRFEKVDAQTLLLLLDTKNICISSGSACQSHNSEPSHVLTGIGLSPDEARESVRISLSSNQSEDEIIFAATTLGVCVSILRQTLNE